MLYRVYVDEAGDRGISEKSGCHLVVSAVIVADDCDAAARAELAALRTNLNRHSDRSALEGSDEVDIRWGIFAGHPFRIASPKEA